MLLCLLLNMTLCCDGIYQILFDFSGKTVQDCWFQSTWMTRLSLIERVR